MLDYGRWERAGTQVSDALSVFPREVCLPQAVHQPETVNSFGKQIVESEWTTHGKAGDEVLLGAFIGEHRLLACGAPKRIEVNSLPHRRGIAFNHLGMKCKNFAPPMRCGFRALLHDQFYQVQ